MSLGRLLGGRVAGGVLGLSGVNYEVFVQLLSVDIVQFTLAERTIGKNVLKGRCRRDFAVLRSFPWSSHCLVPLLALKMPLKISNESYQGGKTNIQRNDHNRCYKKTFSQSETDP